MTNFDKEESLKIYNQIKNGELDFDDFWYGWLDNLKNYEFGQGAEYESERCKKIIKTSYVIDEGDDIIEVILSRIDDWTSYEQ